MRHHQRVHDDAGPTGRQLRISLAAEPVSVPAARRFAADGLTSWGRGDLLDDVALCVTELAGNAALHSSSSFMHVGLDLQPDGVRISVKDDGGVPALAVSPRPGFPGPEEAGELLLEDEATTGRGLAIVSILASDWGVEETSDGKRIWCEITGSPDEHAVRPPTITDDRDAAAVPSDLPDGWVCVRLAGCPVPLSLRQDEHLDELVRELQLAGADNAHPESRALADELQDLLREPAAARHMGRRTAQQAAAEGHETIDVEMAMPREFSGEVEKLEAAVQRADALCEEMRLLTLASSADLRALRQWMTEEIVGQARHGAEPVPWAEWSSAEGRPVP